MINKIPTTEFNKVKYINYIPTDGRQLMLLGFYSAETSEFIMYTPDGKGNLLNFKAEPIQAEYVSNKPVESETDIYLKHLLFNNLSYPEICKIFTSITHDIINFGTIIHKQNIIFDCTKNLLSSPVLVGNIYVTEIEYLMGVLRSYFDLLHDILICLFKRNKLPNLPNSLGKIADADFDKIKQKYNLSQALIDYFSEILPLFRLCRQMRDNIYHRGIDDNLIFITKRGPGINDDYEPFDSFRAFLRKDGVYQNNLIPKNIGSLFYFINLLVLFSIESSNKLADSLEKTFQLPPPILNNYNVYVRSPQIKYINQITDNLKKCWIE
jgi:hypothetical protein